MTSPTPRDAGHQMATVLLVLLVACGGPPTGAALVELPQLRVVAAPPARDSLVHLEVINRTSSALLLDAPICAATLEEYSHGQWFPVERDGGDCVGIEVTVEVDGSYPFGIPPLASRGGYFRAVLTGRNADGRFVVRSPGFDVP